MTEQEILERLKVADRHLTEYKELLKPVLEELAKRKSIHVFGKEGGYEGNFGCWEAGIDCLCLHIEDGFKPPRISDRDKYKKYMARVRSFEDQWNDKTRKIDVKNIYICGHY